MFDFTNYKSFKDTVHGYIQIPKIFVSEIIDTPMFQRLRFVEQTGMRQVYPSARHDRFIHSLGAFYLGTKAVDALLKNFMNTTYWNIYADDRREIFWAKNKVLFLIACLLHDIGHAPFSHSLEHFFVDRDTSNKEDNAFSLKSYFPDDIYNELYEEGTGKLIPQPHEIVSAFIVMNKFKNNISNILDNLKKEYYPIGEPFLVSEHAVIPRVLDKSDIDNDLKFIARMITGIAFKDYEPEEQIKNCFISLLNDPTFDVDKLDYIIRDSKMSGLDNVELDVERLLNSLYIISITKCKDYQYGSKNQNFDDIILKAKTNGEHKFNIKNAYIQGNLSITHGKVIIEKESKIEHLEGKLDTKGCEGPAEFMDSSDVRESGNRVIVTAAKKNYKVLPSFERKLEILLKNAKNYTNFEFFCNEDIVEIENFIGKIQINNGDFEISSATHIKGDFKGKFTELETLGDLLEKHNILPAPEIYNSFQIGFTKQALSVIQNIDVARNYLYLWVYAHHKVVYYANYLIPELVFLAAKIMESDVHEYISFDSITEIDDVTIVSLLREAYKKIKNDKNNQFVTMYNEYTSRIYKKSLFKSLADFDLFFIDFTQSEKNRLKGTLISEGSTGTKQISYGKIENDSLCKQFGIESLIWVDANLSIKELDPGKIYIKYSENEIHTLNQIKILSVKDASKRDNPYFYIYFNLFDDKKEIDINRLKNELLNWFREKIR